MDKKKILATKELKKDFGKGAIINHILKGIDIQIFEGEFVSIMGPSGCGKSTLLYLLGGLDDPTSGDVYLFDENINKLSESRKSKLRCSEIGFVFQFYNLVQGLSVEENIVLPLLMSGVSLAERKGYLDEILKIIDMKDKTHLKPHQLSGGQQQRVAIARALITYPKLILADEPIGNLDSKSGEKIMELLQEINQKYKTTIVQVTHSLESSRYGTRIINMKDGLVSFENKNKEYIEYGKEY